MTQSEYEQNPYFDINGLKILPGHLLAVHDGESFGGKIHFKEGEMYFNETLLDDLMDITENVEVLGWIH